MERRQRSPREIPAVLYILDNQGGGVPQVLSRSLPNVCVKNGVLYKKNFTTTEKPGLLVVPEDLRKEIIRACYEDPIAVLLLKTAQDGS